MFRLSVCAGTVLTDLPFLDRVRRIAERGFVVDLWGWEEEALDAIAADPQIEIGAIAGWGPGSMVHPDGVDAFIAGAVEQLALAARIGCRHLALATGELDQNGQVVHPIADHPATKWITAYKCLGRLAELAEAHDVVYNLELLNTKVDHPGYPFPRVEDGLRLVTEVGSPRIKLLLDLYHAQVEEGNVIELIRRTASHVGYVHVADVPGRHEPGTGEMNYRRVADVLREIGYTGYVGLEAFPIEDSYEAMDRFREVFS